MAVGYSTSVDGQENAIAPHESGRQYLEVSKREWRWAIMFLLSMSLTGLQFYPAILISIVMLFHSWRRDRYDFVVMATIFLGGFGITSNTSYPLKLSDVSLIVGFIGLLITRKNVYLRRITILFIAYVIALYLIAMTSDEAMSVQMRRMRNYWLIVYLYVPIVAFANQKFEVKELFRKLLPFLVVIVSFYVIDAFILHGGVLLPNSDPWAARFGTTSTFYSPNINLFTTNIPRIYPRGLELWALAIIPIAKYYKLRWWQWGLLILSFAASRTMTVLAGLVLGYIFFQGNKKSLIIGTLVAVMALPTLYFVDKNTGDFLRIASTTDQILAVAGGDVEREELGEFASGRMQQVIPKFELMYSMHREWLGLGFLHPDYSTSRKFFIHNDLYSDISQADEVAALVEVGQLQTILDVGYLGLIIQTLFYLTVYFVIRKHKYSQYYLSVLVATSIFAIGGFGGLNQSDGLLLVGFALAVVLIGNKPSPSLGAVEASRA